MLITLLGIFHLIHCPLLIIYPFITNNYDKLYIYYLFLIVLSYTYTNKQCPISYLAHKQLNIKEIKINHYPEMYFITTNNKLIKLYFTITSIIYVYSLYVVIIRNLYSLFYFLNFFSLCIIYFLFDINHDFIRYVLLFLIILF